MNAPLREVLTEADLEIASIAVGAKRRKFDPASALAGPIRLSAPTEFPFLVDRLFPIEVGVFIATGGVGKTTLLIWMITRIALEMDILGHPVNVQRPKILILSNEDGADRWGQRLREICKAMSLTDEQQAIIDSNIFFEDFSGEDVRLGGPTADGDLALNSTTQDLIDAYKDVGLSMVVLDPLQGFNPGDRFVNDGMQLLITAARRICKGLNSFTLLVHHMNKVQAQAGEVVQHGGRGGTALGDGARFEAQVVAHNTRPKKGTARSKEVFMPLSIGEEMLGENGTAYAIHIHKLTDAKRPMQPYWIYRQGFRFEHHPNDNIEMATSTALEKDIERRNKIVRAVVVFIQSNPKLCLSVAKLRDGHAADISAVTQFKVTNAEVREAATAAITAGYIWVEDVPQELKSRGVSTRLVAKPPEY